MDIIELPALQTLSVKQRVPREKLSATLGQVLPRVFAVAAGAQLGPRWPFARYAHGSAGKEVELEAGILTDKIGKSEGDIQAGALPKGKAAEAWHLGPYETLAESWRALEAAVSKKGLKAAGPGFEIYVTDPADEPDANKWKTRIVLPLK